MTSTNSSTAEPSTADDGPSHASPAACDGTLWLSGLPDGVCASDVLALLRRVRQGGPPARADGGGGEGGGDGGDAATSVAIPPCGGFAEVGPLSEAEMARALDSLDGRWWRGARLVALRGEEASAKVAVHQKIKGVHAPISLYCVVLGTSTT